MNFTVWGPEPVTWPWTVWRDPIVPLGPFWEEAAYYCAQTARAELLVSPQKYLEME